MTTKEMLADIKSGRKKKVILDTDAFNEIDDQYAIAYCYLADSIDLVSVNAAPFSHNTEIESFENGMLNSYKEIKKVLSLLNPNYDTPVYEGARTTIEVSGAPVDCPAARNIINTVKASEEPIYVLGIGACTNIASALLIDPSIKDNMGVIWLGGNWLKGGDLGEFNLVQDYTAGQYLMNSTVPLLLCPAWCVVSELTSNIGLTRELKGHNKICDYLFEITENIWKQAGGDEGWVRTIWDIAAPAILDIPECAQITEVCAPVFAESRQYAFDNTRHKMLYLNHIDRELVFRKTWEIITSAE